MRWPRVCGARPRAAPAPVAAPAAGPVPLRECDVRFVCHGGWSQGPLHQHAGGEPGLNYLRPSYNEFFGQVDKPMRAMASLLAAQRAPAEIMDDYAAAGATRGRNETCTSADGRK